MHHAAEPLPEPKLLPLTEGRLTSDPETDDDLLADETSPNGDAPADEARLEAEAAVPSPSRWREVAQQVASGVGGWRDHLLGTVLDWCVQRIEQRPRRGQGGERLPPDERPYRKNIIRALQLRRLKRTVRRAEKCSEFYQASFRQAGISAAEVRTLSDLARLPFVLPEELENPDQLLCVPYEEVDHLFTTTGANGRVKRVYRTARDLDRMVNLEAFLLKLAPTEERMIAAIAHAQGMSGLAGPAQAVVERAGGLALPWGQPETAVAFQEITQHRPNTLMTDPGYLARLTTAAHFHDFKHRFERIVVTGGVCDAGLVAAARETWRAEVFQAYAPMELGTVASGSGPCDALHVNELQAIVEILDPDTGLPSLEGVLVVTTLAQEALPLLRFMTGDLAHWAPCGCGWSAPALRLGARGA